jgi:two-component system, OmpR family, sensor histidine kinase KdpD
MGAALKGRVRLPGFAAVHHRNRRAAGYALAVIGTGILAAALLPVRDNLTPLSKGFGFLVVVVLAAWVGGLGPGLVASLIGFVTFNYFFLPPYNTFIIARGEYVVVLFVFLGLSILISALLARATERAEAAEAREGELRTLFELTSDQVARVPGREAYEAALVRLNEVFGFEAAALFVQETREFVGLKESVVVGAAPGEISAGWDPASEERAPERFPLTVGGRALGLIVFRGDRPPLSPAETRVLRTYCDELALVLERDRLLRTATEAEVYRRSDEVRHSLLAAVSHDLRSPLAAIKASVTDLLADDASLDPVYVREALEGVNTETQRLEALITNLLDMSKIEAGMLKARRQLVELPEVIAAASGRLAREWPGVHVAMDVGADAEAVQGDPVYLDRVMANLLENAAEASRRVGQQNIEVRTRRSGEAESRRRPASSSSTRSSAWRVATGTSGPGSVWPSAKASSS